MNPPVAETPRTDAMIQPIPGKDCVTGEPIQVVHADDVRALERENQELHKEIGLLRYVAAEPHYISKVKDVMGPLSLWSQQGLDAEIARRTDAATKRAEAAESSLRERKGYVLVPEQLTDAMLLVGPQLGFFKASIQRLWPALLQAARSVEPLGERGKEG